MDDEPTWTITALAEEFGVTLRTLRHYEDVGLITPERRGTTRVFHARDRIRLQLILRGKRLGFSLPEIRTIVNMYDEQPGEAGQLQYLLDQIDVRRAELDQIRRDIDETLVELDARRGALPRGPRRAGNRLSMSHRRSTSAEHRRSATFAERPAYVDRRLRHGGRLADVPAARPGRQRAALAGRPDLPRALRAVATARRQPVARGARACRSRCTPRTRRGPARRRLGPGAAAGLRRPTDGAPDPTPSARWRSRSTRRHRGRGLSRRMLGAMRDAARAQGFRELVAPIRPTEKHREPHVPLAEYAARTREDGLPVDAWHAHARAAGCDRRPGRADVDGDRRRAWRAGAPGRVCPSTGAGRSWCPSRWCPWCVTSRTTTRCTSNRTCGCGTRSDTLRGMRYAITGATGFVGGVLARQLRDAGHEVRALVRDPARAAALTGRGVELVPGDLDDAAALDRLVDGVDGLFHVAGWYKLGQRDPSVGDRVNVEGTRNVLAAAQRAGVPRVVHTSTLAVNSDTHGRGVRRDVPAPRRPPEPLRPHQGRGARGRGAVRGRRPAGRDRAARARLRPRRHRADRGPDRPGGPGRSAAGPGRWRRVLGARRGRRRRTRAGHAEGRPRGELHAGRSPRDAGRGSAARRDHRRHQGADGAADRTRARRLAGVAGGLGRVVPLPAGFAAETMRASLATYYGSSAKAERDLGWHARDLDTGLRETVAALRG